MDAIVIAGGVPRPDHPLYPLTQGKPKAMIDMGGRPMIWRVIEGLQAAAQVDDIIVVGLDDEVDRELLRPLHIAHFIPNQGSMVANGFAGMRWVRQHKPQATMVLGCSSDIPHIEGHMVDALIDLCRPFERLMYYGVVTQGDLERVYPGSKRTYTKFKGGLAVAGVDLFVLQMGFLDTDPGLWNKITAARKRPLQVAKVVGWSTLFKLLFRQLSIEEAAATAGRVLGAERPVGIVYPPYPQLAMDGDKPHQIEILRKKFVG